jgi:hypothetical protein
VHPERRGCVDTGGPVGTSVEECRYFLILAKDLGYGDVETLSTMLEQVSRLLGAHAAAILASVS